MIKVQFRDGRVKEFAKKEAAERYAEVTGGTIVKTPVKAKPAPKTKQFSERK